jgi:hypothetical protein
LLIPTGIGAISTIIGIGLLLVIAVRPGRDFMLWAMMGAAVVVFMFAYLLGPTTSRTYLEPFFWMLMVIRLQSDDTLSAGWSWLRWPVRGQAVVTIMCCWLGAVLVFPGALTGKWRDAVMDRCADGYTVMKWADSVLPDHCILLNGQRSMALAPRDAVALDWYSYAPDAEPYLMRLKERGVTHILVTSGSRPHGVLSECMGTLLAGPFTAHLATRNPFNSGAEYQVWIYEFNPDRLPERQLMGK